MIRGRQSRFTVVAALMLGGACLFAACLDDKNPPLPNEAPNRQLITSPAGGSGGGAGVGGGPADNCECVAALGLGATGACGKCFSNILTTQCLTEQSTCMSDGAGGAGGAGGAESCTQVTQCVSACNGDVTCEIACILPPGADQGHTDYNALLTCACAACGSACTSPGVSCASGSGGSGGTLTTITTSTGP